MRIGVTGFPGSGKSTIASSLRSRGFRVLEVSDTIKEDMRKKGMEITPKSIEEYVTKMKARHGKGIFAKETARKLVGYRGDAAVIGMRSVGELRAVRAGLKSKIPLIFLTSPRRMRYRRLSSRRKLPIINYSLFKMRDRSNERMGISKLIHHAEFIISNVGSKGELSSELSYVLRLIRRKGNNI
jgi:dephospho-CoA kinase